MTRVLLVHGAATTGAIWEPVRALLPDFDVVTPDRPCSGSLDDELDWLESLSAGAVVAGISGGATLAIALAARGTRAAALIAHEPAVGSLLPELLAGPGAALAAGGVAAFAATLYGPAWAAHMVGDADAVSTDVAMFRAFEPAPAHASAPPTLVTTGGESPALRHTASARLSAAYGYATSTLPGCRHFLAQESPAAFASLVRAMATGLERG